MKQLLQQLTNQGALGALSAMLRGVEKESLRIDKAGCLAQSVHPSTLGSALTHPYITTDYSEALLEFITPTFSDYEGPIAFLKDLGKFAYENLQNEKLWVASMPCILGGEDAIPVARYGCSNLGKLKTLYREGLAHRYGKLMQTIAGIHYNVSFPVAFWEAFRQVIGSDAALQTFMDERYFALIRNFQRYHWLLLILMGASPAVCKTFLRGRKHSLESLDSHTYYLPHATSLRMSDLGYQNPRQAGLYVSHNDLSAYVETLDHAIRTPHPPYQGKRQLNGNLLQIENEYYASIRPKRTLRDEERPIAALRNRGIEYIEMRCLDLNPFLDVGIDEAQMKFLDVFLLFCLLSESPRLTHEEEKQNRHNLAQVVFSGRDFNLKLNVNHLEQTTLAHAQNIFEQLFVVAEALGSRAVDAVSQYLQTLEQPERLPSARVLAHMRQNQQSFFEFAMERALDTEARFKQMTLQPETRRRFVDEAKRSIEAQAALEKNDTELFDVYLQRYINR